MNTTITLTPEMLAIVPIVTYIVLNIRNIIEPYSWYDKVKRYIPLFALLVGIGTSKIFQVDKFVVSGILTGIASVAGYEMFKTPTTNGTETRIQP